MTKTELISPVTGTAWKFEHQVGDHVEEGATVMILESMKMEVPLEATVSGTIIEIPIEVGASVEEDQVLCVIES